VSHQFKVGDKVRVVAKRPAGAMNRGWVTSMDRYLGSVGVVELVDDGDCPFKVRFPDDYWYYLPEWLIPVTDYRDVLLQIGRLCRNTGAGDSIVNLKAACRDLKEIRRLVEEATGLEFEEYT